METTLTGAIHTIFPEEKYGDFRKRVFWVKEIEGKYPNIWQLELWNSDMPMLDRFRIADLVDCKVRVAGKMYSKNGKDNVINVLRCIGIKKV